MSTPPGIMAVCLIEKYLQKEFSSSPYSIYLDDVRDAGNMAQLSELPNGLAYAKFIYQRKC